MRRTRATRRWELTVVNVVDAPVLVGERTTRPSTASKQEGHDGWSIRSRVGPDSRRSELRLLNRGVLVVIDTHAAGRETKGARGPAHKSVAMFPHVINNGEHMRRNFGSQLLEPRHSAA